MEEFITNLTTKLTEKGLGNSSIKLYINNLTKLNDGVPLKNFKFLEKVDDVMKKLEGLKISTRKSYLTCIVSVLNLYKDNKKLSKLCDKYYAIMNETVKTIKETPMDELSKTQKDNWMNWEDVMEHFNNIHTSVMKFINNKELSQNQYIQLLNLVVLSLYCLTPPRRNMDYSLMDIVKSKTNTDDKTKNYLVYDEKLFIFNVFKTSKHYEDTEIKIPDNLFHIIEMYIKFHPMLKNGKIIKTTDIPFLVNYQGEALKSINSITRILNKVFGKNIGVSMLRHSYLTSKYGKQSKEMEDDAMKMGHNSATQKAYIKDV